MAFKIEFADVLDSSKVDTEVTNAVKRHKLDIRDINKLTDLGSAGYYLGADGLYHSTSEASGDMARSVYDTNFSSIVDDSERLGGVLPDGYALKIHEHVESDITDLDKYTKAESDANLSLHTSKIDNPHSVTKVQVGLGNVDNTSDIDKPVSTATQTQLDLKFDKASVVDDLVTADTAKALSANMGKKLQDTKSQWKGDWGPNTYYLNEWVRDGDYTGIVNVASTDDRLAPQKIGNPFNLYTGTLTPFDTTAAQIIFGQRYNSNVAVEVTGYRVYVSIGVYYEVYKIANPLVDPIYTLMHSFTATIDGWMDVAITPVIVDAGVVFDVAARAYESGNIGDEETYNYNYRTPNNPSTPNAGEIQHANKELGTLRVHKTDNDGTDRSLFLSALMVGDIIEIGNVSYTIQSVTDDGSYYTFGVTPQTQYSSDGVIAVVFKTIIAVPITTGKEIDYNASTTSQGLFIVDGKHADIVPDNNQYGLDLRLQEISLSSDWDIVADSGGGGTVDNAVVSNTDVVTGSSRVINVVEISQGAYDLLPSADNNTLFFIPE